MSVRRSSSTREATIGAALLAVLSLTAAGQQANPEAAPLTRGEALFRGEVPLQGKPRGHVDFMPPEVVRCTNCHGPSSAGTKLKLDGASLLEARPRRNGPPSAYDQTKFCKLLRTGVDPAFVMIDHAMPVYDLPDADCAALWAYITRTEASHSGKTDSKTEGKPDGK